MSTLKVGAAARTINNELGRPIQGATVDNVAEYIRDNLEANGLYLENNDVRMFLVSCDFIGIPKEHMQPIRQKIAEAIDIPLDNIVVAATHQHSGPSILPTNPQKEIDTEYLDQLGNWLAELASEARHNASPAKAGWAKGNAKLGYNRRCCWADGTHTMYGDTQDPAFTGLEGPEDDDHIAMFFTDEADTLLGVIHANTVHPVAFYGHNFYSADFPGAARNYLREIFSENLPVLFFNGAEGDINNAAVQFPKNAESREQRMLRCAHIAAGETLRLYHECVFHEDVSLAINTACEEYSVRLPDEVTVQEAQSVLAKAERGEEVKRMEHTLAYGTMRLVERFGDTGTDNLPLSALRIGDVAWLAEPCELFCQFGLDIKRRSPFPITGMIGQANGSEGYIPTVYGAIGGGYSGQPIDWTRFTYDTGYRLVDDASRHLRAVYSCKNGT